MNNDFNENGMYTVLQEDLNTFMTHVFGWMFCGLLVTAGVSYAAAIGIAINASFRAAMLNPVTLIALVITNIGLVIGLTRGVKRISAATATMMFLLYAVLNGVMFSFIFLVYTNALITQAFVCSAAFFGVMALYGFFTKADLSSVGKILLVGLITLLVVSVINLIIKSDSLDFIICIAGVGVFTGLTAFDVQRIKTNYLGFASAGGAEAAAKMSIMGALTLYLDFINLFLYILRILGRRR